jgi:glucokinase
MDALLGIEIGGTKLQMVLADVDGSIVDRRKFAVAREQGAQGIRDRIQAELPGLIGSHKLLAAGVGFGGPMDSRTGKVACSHHIEGWSEFDLADWLGRLTNTSVAADNDANVAALGEARRGAGKNRNPVFYVTLGSGVGGGLVVDGKIYHGLIPGEAEIGHLRLDREGTILESRCSGWAVDRKVREAVAKESSIPLAQLVRESPGAEARHLANALKQKDPLAQRILQDVAGDLAFGLSHVVHLFHPEVIVLGGGLSRLGEPLRVEVAGALDSNIMEAFKPAPAIQLAILGEDAVPVGAIELAREIA